MTPDKDFNTWQMGLAAIGGLVANIDTGMRTLLLCAAAALIAILLGMGYNSMSTALSDLKTGQNTLRSENCDNYTKLDNRLRTVENTQVEVKTMVKDHLDMSNRKK